jgi:hypothetical protein
MPVVSNDLFIFFDLFSISLFKIANMYVIWRCEAGLLDDCISRRRRFLLHYVWARFASSIVKGRMTPQASSSALTLLITSTHEAPTPIN